MKRRTLGLCIVLLAVVGLRTVIARDAPEKPDVTARLAAALEPLRKARADDPAVWACARKIEAMGKAALPGIRTAAAAARAVPAKLALGRALLALQDFGPGLKVLSSVVSGGAGADARIAAARVLGDVGGNAAEVELTGLIDSVKDEAVRIALAQALSTAATTEAAQRKATTTLVRLARVGKGRVRAAAALALGELDDFRDPVPAVLKELAIEPTARGRLARKLLELKRLTDLWLRKNDYKGSLGHAILDEIKDLINERHIEPPPKPEALVDAAARGMVSALHKTDPFSSYMDPRRHAEFREAMSGQYGGIGAHVRFLKDDRTGEKVFTAVKPIYSGPAYKAGLRSYDQFVEIDGIDIKGKTALELRDMLRGLPESVVACKIRRRGTEKDQELLLKIIRGSITVPTVCHELLPGGIGYLRLDGFGDTSTAEIEAALRQMEKAGLKALVFDVRGNPGGYLKAALDIADKFLKKDKLIVYSEGRNKKIAPRDEKRTTGPATHPDFPIIVLVDGGSASASEVVAGALQDHKRALLVGERTFGKGSVQQLIHLESTGKKAILKLTVAKYFLPSGRSIHRSIKNRGGIIPDIKVPFERDWTHEHFEKQRAAGDFRRYSLVQWPKHKKTLMALARFDNHDESKYPGFDKWYKDLKLKTDRESARRLLRQWLRVLTADELARDWAADLDEDNQLQRAVYEAGKKIPRLDMKAVPEYKRFVTGIEKKLARAAKEK